MVKSVKTAKNLPSLDDMPCACIVRAWDPRITEVKSRDEYAERMRSAPIVNRVHDDGYVVKHTVDYIRPLADGVELIAMTATPEHMVYTRGIYRGTTSHGNWHVIEDESGEIRLLRTRDTEIYEDLSAGEVRA